MYQDKLLPHLESASAVEYMLQCIPHLFKFHKSHDEEYRENLMAAAVILRQYEEMDETETETNVHGSAISDPTQQRASFLAITQAIIESSASFPTSPRQQLANAAFWMAVRQEIYNAFTRKRPFQMRIT